MKTEGKRPRILTLDILRGFLLCVILIDHLGFFPSPFEFFTGRGLLWASAAEGFFIISGILVGYVYAPRMIAGAKAATLKIWRRAGVIYAGFVLVTLVMVALGHLISPPMNGSGLWVDPSWLGLLLQTFGLQYTYGWADFLRYYALFMLAAPLVLWLCVKRLGWVVIAVTVTLWLARGENIWLAWQLLFMGGIVAGYYLPSMQHRLQKLGEVRTRAIRRGIYIVAAVTILTSVLTQRAAVFLTQTYDGFAALPAWVQSAANSLYGVHDSIAPLIDKDSLAPLRLVMAIIWFTAIYLFIRYHEASIEKLARGSLRVIGENSLLVYIIEAFVIYLLLSVLAPDLPIVINTIITTLALALIYVIAQFRSTARRTAGKTKPPHGFAAYLRHYVGVYSLPKQPHLVSAFVLIIIALGCLAYIYKAQPVVAVTPAPIVEKPIEDEKPFVPVYNLGEIVSDVPYCMDQLLDIYQPRQTVYKQSPIAMYIHGGAWQINDKASEPDQLAMIDGLRDRGYAVVSINYSKTPDQYYPVAVQESLCAIRFLRAHAAEYGFDGTKIALYGFSAGGYLAAMVGALPDDSQYEGDEYTGESSRVQAVVTLAGLYSFTEALNPNNRVNIARFLQGTDPAGAEVMQYFDKTDPPFLLVHGVDDQLVQVAQDDLAEMRMRSKGIDVQRLLVVQAEHGLNATGANMTPTREEVAGQIQDYIASKLTPSQP